MADDDADGAVDESAYDLGSVKRARYEEPAISMPMSTAASDEPSEPAPDWANKWKEKQKQPPKLKGSCVTWHAKKGFGFIKRDDDQPDLYVHQRDVQKSGFRSLREGEQLEFDVAAMDDGRLHAVRVTGPGGVDVLGQPRKDDKDDDDDDPPARGAGGDATKQQSSSEPAAKPKPNPFVPRAVARPKAPAQKPKPKPPPTGESSGSGSAPA